MTSEFSFYLLRLNYMPILSQSLPKGNGGGMINREQFFLGSGPITTEKDGDLIHG